MRAISRAYSRKNTAKFDKLRDLVYVNSFETNVYWRTISTNPLYVAPTRKQLLVGDRYNAPLEYLQATAAGIDGLPLKLLNAVTSLLSYTLFVGSK